MRADNTRTISSLIVERAVLASLLTAILALGWLVASGWAVTPAMLLIPALVVSADTLFFWLVGRKREGIWLCVYLAFATVSAFLFLSLVAWLLPTGLGLGAIGMIAGGYFAVRLSMLLVA